MQNARLEETQVGIKIARRNINNLRYADNTTLMAESEKELKSLLMKVKEENEKTGLKLNIQKLIIYIKRIYIKYTYIYIYIKSRDTSRKRKTPTKIREKDKPILKMVKRFEKRLIHKTEYPND